MKRFVALLVSLVLVFSLVAFADSESEVVYARITLEPNTNTTPLHKLPGDYRPVIANLQKGTQVIILFEGSTWHKIQLNGTETVGWVKSSCVQVTTRGISALNLGSTLLSAKTVKSRDGFAVMRWGAGTEYDAIDNLSNGTYLWVYETEGEWSRVLDINGRVGYVYSSLLTGTTRMAEWPAGFKAYVQVSGDSANFRSAPSYSSNVVSQLYSGDVVEVLGDEKGFLYVNKNGKLGYISHDIISPKGLNRVIATAPLFYDNPSAYPGMTDVLVYTSSNTLVKVLATDGRVSRIAYDNIDGYVLNNCLAY